MKERLTEGGGYDVVHSTPGIEISVYVLVAPQLTANRRTPTTRSTSCSKEEGMLEVEGEQIELRGYAVFVPAGAEHRFVGYESLTVLVVFDREPQQASTGYL